MGNKPTPTNKQPKTVSLATYLQSLAIAILLTGMLSFIASYFLTISIHADARQAVSADMQLVSKAKQ